MTSRAPVGRWRAAFRVLRGREIVPEQIRAEWLEYKQLFDDILTRLSTQLARKAKAERKQLKQLLELQEEQLGDDANGHKAPLDRKAELRRRAARARGLRS